MATIASLQTETEVASLTQDDESVANSLPSVIQEIQRGSSYGTIAHIPSGEIASPRRQRVRDPPAARFDPPTRMEQQEALSPRSRRSTHPSSSSPIILADSVEEEEPPSVGAFVLVDGVDSATPSDSARAGPVPVTGGDTRGEAVVVQVDTSVDVVQDAVFANDTGVAMAAATLDDSAQEATVVASTPSEAEWTEELDEKIAAAMGGALDVTVNTQEEEATVVGITEHDVHPSDMPRGEVRAELIGEDYTRTVNVPGATSHRSPRHEEEVTVVEIEQNAVLPSVSRDEDGVAPTRVARLSPTSVNVSSAVASAVSLNSTEEEATVLGIEDNVHPADFSTDDVAATLIERDSSAAPPARPTPLGRPGRAVSAPNVSPSLTNPFQDDPHDTPAMSRDGLAALDAAEDRAWLSQPSVASPNIPVILPPQIPRSSSEPSAGVASANVAETATVSPCASGLEQSPGAGSSSQEALPAAMPPRRPFSGGSGESARESSGSGSDGVAARATSLGSASDATAGTASRTSSSGHWGGSQRFHRLSNIALRSTKDVMEKLIDSGSRRRNGRHEPICPAECILQRTLLPWSVFHNDTTSMWIATVNTNQKALDSKNIGEASRALKAFSLPTRRAAEEVGLAMAPPRMLPFDSNPFCHLCKCKFSVFRRACHCRNCGVCVCSSCAIARPSKMVPTTYNIKNEGTVNICKSCDWLSSAFRTALLNGQQDEALALYSTGNINVGTPFANVKGELLFPVHCAVMGGNIDLVKWLIDGRCCPIRYMRSRDLAKNKGVPLPLLTSKGRSLLGVALTDKKVATEHKVDIIRYLVVEKNMSLFDEKDLGMSTALMALTAVLHQLPRDSSNGTQNQMDPDISASIAAALTEASINNMVNGGLSESQNELHSASLSSPDSEQREDGTTPPVDDCIICFDNPIDCVITPCGHQICCMQCSANITSCPVCSVPCSFIRVYKA